MRLPAPLLRNNPYSYKNRFGHVLVVAGSKTMLGAGCLTSLAAVRAGAGLVTLGVPESLNLTAQRKCSNTVMTLPLKETEKLAISSRAVSQVLKTDKKFQVMAIGPGLTTGADTKKFVLKIVETSSISLVIDADAINCVSQNTDVLLSTDTPKILTPHFGEMLRLINKEKDGMPDIDCDDTRAKLACEFAAKYKCVLLLKGHRTVVSDGRKVYINKTGNCGMATAGSGDVLTGIISAFVAQGVSGFDSAKFGAYVHGLAGDLAAKDNARISLIATDIIEYLPKAFKISEKL